MPLFRPRRRFAARSLAPCLAALAMAVPATGAFAQACGNDGAGFNAWLGQYRQKAAGQGITPRGLAALDGLSYDPNVIRLDRGQKSFKLSFEEFYARRAGPGLINRGKSMMQTHAATLARIEKQYGVPPSVLVAIWGLETNYGSDGGGGKSIVRSIATLAYDCRRTDFFQNELVHALRIVDRGDMTPAQMVGGWAGEIGPMQFLPSSYFKFAVDFDGDGRRDLMRSVPDMLASTANFLKSKGGWRAGQPWGPGTANYGALQEWNKAEVYQRTIAVMSERMAGRS
jgi:lytic murein transglycosylase